MNPPAIPTRVAITGGAGFLGRALTSCLSAHFPLRVLDVQPTEGPWQTMVGSAAELDVALALCRGCSDLVIAHMAPNRPEIYGTPPVPFDVNVTGTANLFHAACAHGLRRVILISSTAVVDGAKQAGTFLSRDLPLTPTSMYGMTKALQENIAEYYHRQQGMEVAAFRPAYICDEASMIDKYGRKMSDGYWVMIDPLDIAEGVRLALLAPKLDYEIFYILGHEDSEKYADVGHLRDFLGWQPQHVFRTALEAKVS